MDDTKVLDVWIPLETASLRKRNDKLFYVSTINQYYTQGLLRQ